MKRIALVTASILIGGAANADTVWTEWHGNTRPEDYSNLVTAKILDRFPSEKWALFVDSSAFTLGQQFICVASVGIVPRGLNQFPSHVYQSARSRKAAEKGLLIGEQRAFEAECVRFAIKNMLSDNIENVYRKYPAEQ